MPYHIGNVHPRTGEAAPGQRPGHYQWWASPHLRKRWQGRHRTIHRGAGGPTKAEPPFAHRAGGHVTMGGRLQHRHIFKVAAAVLAYATEWAAAIGSRRVPVVALDRARVPRASSCSPQQGSSSRKGEGTSWSTEPFGKGPLTVVCVPKRNWGPPARFLHTQRSGLPCSHLHPAWWNASGRPSKGQGSETADPDRVEHKRARCSPETTKHTPEAITSEN